MQRTCYVIYFLFTENNTSGKQTLMNLIDDINDKRAFTAKGFFEIKRSTLASMVGILSTYLVIMLQSR